MSRACLILLLVLATTSGEAACSRVLRVPFEHWRPYAYLDAAGKPTGLEVALLKAIGQEAGCHIRYLQDIPRKRRLLMFRQGEIDLLLAASDTPERQAYAWFSLPYREEEVLPFALAGDESVRSLTSLDMVLAARLPLIVPSDGWYGARYARLLQDFETAGLLTRYERYEQAARLLASGRGRVVIGDRYALRLSAREAGAQLAEMDFVINRDPVHLMLSKRSLLPADRDALDGAIRRLIQRGTLQAIRARYLNMAPAGH
ncbi:substrate-binding periplasmic protein [Chitinimonas sp.]|uniref:substrate-binding periplasmic protein n=1 Tax=Chitinimonas sp. TaxID=1934313 RepID=UPI002F924E3B